MTKQSLILIPIITILTLGFLTGNAEASGTGSENSNGEVEYSIYPVPRDLEYGDGELTLEKNVQIVYDYTIDEVTKNKVIEVFNSHDLPEPEITDTPSDDAVKIYIGTDGSEDLAEHYGKEMSTNDSMNFDNIDAYHLEINNDGISILGKDTDAAFYGVATLNAILDQAEDNRLRHLQIDDYADTEVRGFIEGYYGIPWSDEDRKSLMEFGGDFKTTSYIFAPKDDPYHREEWSELYPEAELSAISEMVEVGEQNKTDFVWTISPLGDVAEIAQNEGDEAAMELLDGNTDKLLKKFDQLYDAGVRQYGILGDDVGELPLDYVVGLMNSISDWAETKGDVKDTIYTPAAYNSDWAWDDGEELNVLQENFDENIHIMWTGETTVAPVEQYTVDRFKNLDNNGVERRDPLFWLNWPVNDIDMERVFLGKGDMLEQNVEQLAGVVTNPMQEAQASKISIFAVADYAWNNTDFDAQINWEDSMKYIEPNVTESFYTLAKHMTHADPEVGFEAEESEDIKELLDETLEALNSDESIEDISQELIVELEVIADAGQEFLTESENYNLRQELTPFVNALYDMVLADIKYLNAQQAIEANEMGEAEQLFEEGRNLREQSLDHNRPMLEGEDPVKAKPAAKRLQPFTDELEERIEDNLE